MASLDSVSIAILLGAVLVMAGILPSLLALRFGAPLLLVFLFIGMLAGDAGPGQLRFDDVRTTYLVGSVALALILFDGGLKTRFQSIRAVLAPSMALATIGVLVTALITAPVAKYVLDLNWTEALLVGAVVGSTDAAAVFLLVHAQGLRLRPRVGATLEAESGTTDPCAVFLTLMLVELISIGESSALHVALEFAREAVLGTIVGVIGGRLVVLALNRVALPQGPHAPFFAPAGAAGRQHYSGGAGGAGADAGGAAAGGIPLSRAISLQLAGKDLHRLDRPAGRGRGPPRVDPDAGRAVEGLSLFRRRLCRRHHLAAAAGLDAGGGGAGAACGAGARRSRSAAPRGRSGPP